MVDGISNAFLRFQLKNIDIKNLHFVFSPSFVLRDKTKTCDRGQRYNISAYYFNCFL